VKTSVAIVTSFFVGALVTFLLSGWGSGDQAAQSVAPHVAASEGAASIPAPVTVKTPAQTKSRVNVDTPARIHIPSLHLTARVGTSLNKGPAWWPVTGRPGGGDTIAIAGHRTTYTHPFLDLDRLEPGDVIYLRWQGVAHRYVMSGRRILSHKQRHIADARGHELLLLTACTPKGSARQRIVIYAWPDERQVNASAS
jgi:LPXTG-site transpeptidase (sortase) family protein